MNWHYFILLENLLLAILSSFRWSNRNTKSPLLIKIDWITPYNKHQNFSYLTQHKFTSHRISTLYIWAILLSGDFHLCNLVVQVTLIFFFFLCHHDCNVRGEANGGFSRWHLSALTWPRFLSLSHTAPPPPPPEIASWFCLTARRNKEV